jgi:ribonucleotide reductase beta subunit family protein with ferritin-like domain
MSDRINTLKTLAEGLTLYEACTILTMVRSRECPDNGKRFGVYPIQDISKFQRGKYMEASLWSASEVLFKDDIDDFEAMDENHRRPLKLIFGLFAIADGVISENLMNYLLNCSQTLEENYFYIHQLQNELVHAETYGKMIFTLVRDEQERDDIFEAVHKIKSIGNISDLVFEVIQNPDGQRQLYITMAITELLVFTPLFCIIFWYRTYMPGKIRNIIFSNEMIGRDEAHHGLNSCLNYISLPKESRYTDNEVFAMVAKFMIRIEEFIHEIFDTIQLTDIDADRVIKYAKYVADDMLVRCGHSPMYNQSCPFSWMLFLNQTQVKTNFYEATVGEYKRFDPDAKVKEAMQLCGINTENKESHVDDDWE